MVGLIWVIQLVHYPLFAQVGTEQFRIYEGEHTRLITFIVGPVMLIELLSALALLAESPPTGVPGWLPWLLVGLLGLVWLSTIFLQIPLHGQLTAGFDIVTHGRLVATNWIRTVAWTLRGVILFWVFYKWIISEFKPL